MKQTRWLTLALLAFAGLWLVGPGPAAAQCLPESQCAALKNDLRELRDEARQIKRQLRDLRREARGLPRNSPERRAIRDRSRSLRRELRDKRHEARPLYQQFRDGCRAC